MGFVPWLAVEVRTNLHMLKFNNIKLHWSQNMPTSVALTPYFESYTKQLVASGRYNNVSEVIRDSLRLHEEKLKQEDTRLKALLGAVQLGMDDFETGRVVSFSSAKQFGTHLKALRAGRTPA